MELRDLTVLKKRSDYVLAQRGRAVHGTGFTLRARKRENSSDIRVGFTCSKKVGNAVARNRAKRRLREAARLILPVSGNTGWDYVLIGHKDSTSSVPFAALCKDIERAVRKISGPHT